MEMNTKNHKHVPLIFFVLLAILTSWGTSVKAQRDSIWIASGDIRDDFTNAKINTGKAYIMTRDSVVIDSTELYDNGLNGTFHFYVEKAKLGRSFIVKTTNPDYEPSYNSFSMKYMSKQSSYDLSAIYMKRKTSFGMQQLDELVVTATKVKMYYRGDTLVFNADAFNVAEGSMLDALIKQMPGTELTKQGEIFVNGRKVENLLLNGKDFFRGNNKIMLENLPYYTVKEVKVYEQTQEKALALHDTYAEKDFVMDVNLKREYNKGYMGNVEVGAGTQDVYMARLFGLMYTDASRFAIVGGANNMNTGAYTTNGYALDNTKRDGRTTNRMLTAELLTDNKRRKNVLTVELTRNNAEQGSDVFEETFHNTASTFSTTQNLYTNKNTGASLINKFTLKEPLWLESTTRLRLNSKKDDSNSLYFESGSDSRQQGQLVLDSLFNQGLAINDPLMTIARKRWTKTKEKEYGASQDFSISKKLATTDILDFNAGVDYRKSTHETDRFNRYLTWKNGQSKTDVTEIVDRPNTHFDAKADINLKNSRLFYDTQIELHAGYHFNYDKDKDWITDGVSFAVDKGNSYRKRMTENQYLVSLRYFYDHVIENTDKHTALDVKLPVSFIHRKTDYSRYPVDTCLLQSPIFFEPSLSVKHEKWKNGYHLVDWGIELKTSLKHNLPDATQLITLPLTSDRINIYQGNAHLKTPSIWESELSWYIPVKGEMTEFFQSLTFTKYFNQIVSTYKYDSGVYTHKPDNINGTWELSFYSGTHYDFKMLKKNIYFRWTIDSRFRRMKNFVADGVMGQSQEVDNDELRVNVPLYFSTSISKSLWIGVSTGIDWRKCLKDNVGIADREVWDYHSDIMAEVKLFADISLKTDCDIIKRNGYSDSDLKKWNFLWDMTLSKSIFKNKIGLTLRAIDILHQYKSVAYVVNERGIRETHAIALPSYWLFTVTYKFNKQPKK